MASRIGVGALALALLGGGVCAVCVGRSAAQPLTEEFTNQTGGWKAKVLYDSDGRPSCGAGRLSNRDGATLGLVASPDDRVALALQVPSWQLEPSKSVELTVTFDARATYRVSGQTPDSHTLMFRTPGDEFDEQFRRSRTMSILFQGQNLSFNLAGTSRLLPILRDCARQASLGKSPDAALAAARPGGASNTFYAEESVDFKVFPQSTLKKDVGNPTPLAIPGARTVMTMELKQAMDAGEPMILVDALESRHAMTIQGAVSLPYAGSFGTFHDQIQTVLAEALTNLLQGRAEASLVFFCQGPKCWESYNAALRARAAGFENVSWYRGGLAAWKAAGFPMQPNSGE